MASFFSVRIAIPEDFHGRLVVEFIEDHLSLAVLSFNAVHDSLVLSSLLGDHPNDDTTAKHHLATTMTHSRQMTIIFLSLFKRESNLALLRLPCVFFFQRSKLSTFVVQKVLH